MIWLILIASALVTIIFLAWFVWKPLEQSVFTSKTANIALAKLKLTELSQDGNNNLLDKQNFNQAKQDISQTLAAELSQNKVSNKAITSPANNALMFLLITMIVLSLTVIVYQFVGSSNIQTNLKELNAVKTIEDLQKYVSNNPKNIQANKMLAYAYFSNNDLEKSQKYYHQAYELAPNDTEILVEYASVLAAMQDNSLAGQPAKLIQQALIVDNNNLTALYLAGLAAYQQGQYSLTQKAWQRALKQAPKDGGDYQTINKQLQLLASELSQESTLTTPAQTNTLPVQDVTYPKRSIVVSVALSTNLKAQSSPDDFVLIYAKNAKGRPMPLAIFKQKVKDLPLTVSLTDAQSMIPNMNLSNASDILVVARLSKSGQAFKQAGDIEVVSAIINLNKAPTPTINLVLK